MSRAFLINIGLLIFINILIKPFYVLVIDVSVQNTIGPSAYGIFFSLFNFCYLFQVISDLGIQNYNSKTIAQKSSLVQEFIPKILSLKLLLSLLFLVLIFVLALLFNYPNFYFKFLVFIAINQLILSFILYGRGNLSALTYFKTDSILSALDKFLLILFLSYLLFVNPHRIEFSLEWFIWAQSLSLGITFFVVYFILYQKTKFSGLRFSYSFSKKLLKKTWPYATVIILMTAYTRMDAVMIERMLADGSTEAGIYAAAYRLLDASNMIAYLFAVLLLPMFSRMIAEKQDVRALLSLSYKIILVICIVVVLSCFFQRNDIMRFLYPADANTYYGNVLGILIFSFGAIGLSYIYGTLLTAGGKIYQLNKIFALGVLINLSLNLILIPIYKATGAAVATVITQFFVMAGQVRLSYSVFKWKLITKQIVRNFILIIFSVIIFWGLADFQVLPWWGNILLGSLSCILVSLLIKFIDIAELKQVLLSKE